jgi:acyl dehydratase
VVVQERLDALEQVCERARARTGHVASEALGALSVRDFCRYAVAVGDTGYRKAARLDEAHGRPVLAPPLFVTGILGWEDGPATDDLHPDGLAPGEAPCTGGLPVTQMHGGQDVEITELPAAGHVLWADRLIEGATSKQGRSGPFVVLRLVTAFRDGQGKTLITKRESIIIKPDASGPPHQRPAAPAAPNPVAAGPGSPHPVVMTWTPTSVQLFRFSAVSWNAHRVHYDLQFARQAGFPGVLVQSTLHGEMLARAALTAAGNGARLRRIAWRNHHPAFAGQTLRYAVTPCGRPEQSGGTLPGPAVVAWDQQGRACASADVVLTVPPAETR